MTAHKITPFLWFDGNAEEAVTLYASIFPGSKVLETGRWGEGGPGKPGTVMNMTFELAGQRFHALNGGPEYKFTPAISLFVSCQDQAELDGYWSALLAGGGRPTGCGWLVDRFGLSWQIIPSILGRLLGDPDRAKGGRAMQAMLGMQKLDIAALERAHAGR
jgi:predicted 3-demethylubiquinone-9 3-methyltransferase (glyoxalase superfamily)